MFASLPLPVYRFRLNSRRCMYTRAHSRCHFSPHAKPPWSPTLSVYNNPSVCYNILSILTCRYNIRAITMTECNETPDRSLFAPVQNVFFFFFFCPWCACAAALVPFVRVCLCVRAKNFGGKRRGIDRHTTVTKWRTIKFKKKEETNIEWNSGSNFRIYSKKQMGGKEGVMKRPWTWSWEPPNGRWCGE